MFFLQFSCSLVIFLPIIVFLSFFHYICTDDKKEAMKKFILIFTTLLMQVLQISAQKNKPFEGHFINDEHQVFLHINLYAKNIKIPGQDLLGEMSGYIGSHKDSRQWFILDSQLISDNQAQLSVINDYGSEDLEAQLIFTNDSICTLKQITGSPIKFAINNKWVKIPKNLILKRRK